MKLKATLLAVIAGTTLLTGCDIALDKNKPVSVARAFWNSTFSEDLSAAKYYMADSTVPLGIKGRNVEDTAGLGEIQQQDGYYFIDTQLTLHRDGKIYRIPLKTIVTPVDGIWKVDYWATKQSVHDAAFDNAMKYYANSIHGSSYIFEDLYGGEDRVEAYKSAESRVNQQFDDFKKAIMLNYERSLQITQKEIIEAEEAAKAAEEEAAKKK